jgi:hypothetical protein
MISDQFRIKVLEKIATDPIIDAADAHAYSLAHEADNAKASRDRWGVASNVGTGAMAAGGAGALWNASKILNGTKNVRKGGWRGLLASALVSGAGYELNRLAGSQRQEAERAFNERQKQVDALRARLQEAKAGRPQQMQPPARTGQQQGVVYYPQQQGVVYYPQQQGGVYYPQQQGGWGEYVPPRPRRLPSWARR